MWETIGRPWMVRLVPGIVISLGLMTAPVYAQSGGVSDFLDLHGFGHLNLSDNLEDEGETTGNYDLFLLGTANLTDQIHIWGQGWARDNDIDGLDTEVVLDWAFLDWSVTPKASVRVGQIRMPFGLNNELRDLQALRYSVSLPYIIDEELGLTDEAFQGGSFEYRNVFGNGMEYTLDLFAAAKTIPEAGESFHSDIGGARLALMPRGADMTYKFSYYSGHQTGANESVELKVLEQGVVIKKFNKQAMALSVQKVWDTWTLTSEYGRGDVGGLKIDTVYMQLDKKWTPVVGHYLRAETLRKKHNYDHDEIHSHQFATGLAWNIAAHFGARLEVALNREDGRDHEEIETIGHSWLQMTAALNFIF